MKPIVKYKYKNLYLEKGTYPNGRIALLLIDKNGNIWDDLSKNLSDIKINDNEMFLNSRIPDDLKQKLYDTEVFINLFYKEKGCYDKVYINRHLLANYIDEEYCIEIWETERDRDAGEGYIYNKTYSNFESALKEARHLYEYYNYASVEIMNDEDNVLYCCDSDSEEFYIENETIACVSRDIIHSYINDWSEHKEQTIKNDKLYCRDNNVFIAIDNTTGNCWVEEFETEKAAQNWLLGKDKQEEVVNEI